MGNTHFSSISGRLRTDKEAAPQTGEIQYDSVNSSFMVWNGTDWIGIELTTSTSTSTSTTTTSTSTTTE